MSSLVICPSCWQNKINDAVTDDQVSELIALDFAGLLYAIHFLVTNQCLNWRVGYRLYLTPVSFIQVICPVSWSDEFFFMCLLFAHIISATCAHSILRPIINQVYEIIGIWY